MKINEHAQILIESLPYIQRYSGKTIVIKYGGNAMTSEELRQAVISDVVLLRCVNINVVLVHGGGPEINEMLGKIGKESKFVGGLRYTDEETMDIVKMVLCGKVNKELVSIINSDKGKAVGISGIDSNLITVKKLSDGNDYGYVGDITAINPQIVQDLTKEGYIPVISTVGTDKNGEFYNINADLAAAEIAASIKAERLLILTDVKGVLKDPSDEETLIKEIQVSNVMKLIKDGIIKGGMKPKIDCCVTAVRKGVKSATIIDGRNPHSLLIELFSDEGSGTMIH